MSKELISVVMDSARTIMTMKNINKTDKRIEPDNFHVRNAIHWLDNFLSNVFYKLTLEEMCEMAGMEFIEINKSASFVVRTNNGSREAFLIYNKWSYGENKGFISFHLEELNLRENFRSVCLCNHCTRKDSMSFWIKSAKQHGIKKIFTRIKKESFEIEGIVFQEITEFPEMSKIAIPIV